jgi:glycerol-3-phosphate acyltransferase PlsY
MIRMPWAISDDVLNQLYLAILIISAVLLGSIPFGLLFVRWIARRDIRTVGSGNIGATNVRRVAGTPLALVVLICDVLKGALPVIAAGWLTDHYGYGTWVAAVAALAAVLGHMFPAYLKFKPSGKGVATALGAFAIISPTAVSAGLGIFILLAAITRRTSVGSLAGVATLTPAVWLTTHQPAFTLAAAVTTVLIFLRHKDNIRRLLQGREPTLDEKLQR